MMVAGPDGISKARIGQVDPREPDDHPIQTGRLRRTGFARAVGGKGRALA